MIVDFKFNNGEEVIDLVSGLKGIIDCSSLWMNGCRRYSVQPRVKKGETSKPDSIWFDEETLSKVSDGLVEKIKPSNTGGPSFKSDSARF